MQRSGSGKNRLLPYSRAFRKLFGIEPHKVKLKQTSQLALTWLIKKTNREVIDAEMLDLPEQHLRGFYGKDFHEQSYYKVAQGLYRDIARHLGLTDGFDFNKHHLIGISLESPWRTAQTESKFFAGVKLENDTEIDWSGLKSHLLPAVSWQRFEHERAFTGIRAVGNNTVVNNAGTITGQADDGLRIQSGGVLTNSGIILGGTEELRGRSSEGILAIGLAGREIELGTVQLVIDNQTDGVISGYRNAMNISQHNSEIITTV
jgi:hypothetical protein